MGSALTACSHCGLPCAFGDAFCCYGCEIAAELSRDDGPSHHTRASLAVSALLFMGVMMLALVLYAEDVYDLDSTGADDQLAAVRGVFRYASGVLATPVVVLLGVPLLRRALRAGRANLDLLIASGALSAYGLSVYSLATGATAIYFDTACAALVLTTLGRYVEARARSSASAQLGQDIAASAAPVRARVGTAWTEAAPAEIAPGAQLRVAEGQTVPVDARVEAGPVDVSLAVVTGESRPITVGAGDAVPAGAVPVSGELECTAARSYRESTLARLENLARSLRDQRAPVQQLADRFAAAFVPIVYVLALASLAYWAYTASADRAVVVALAVVLAACPCTYGVATPLALWLALRTALRHGVLIRDATALEALSGVRGVVFDKTGTLTDDVAVRVVYTAPGIARSEALALAAALEAASPHPLARAIVRQADADGVTPTIVRSRVATATGVRGDGAFIGRARGAVPWAPADAVVLERDGIAIAAFDIGEALRARAQAAVDDLRAAGLDVAIATGDSAERARQIADQLGVRADAALTPAAKAAMLGPDVAMVGDGLNDAPALARAQPSFAVADATGLARGVASVALLRSDLRLVPWTLALARRTRALIRSNLIWATAYNAAFVALAAAGALRPVFAALAMITSSAIVVGRALALAHIAPPQDAVS